MTRHGRRRATPPCLTLTPAFLRPDLEQLGAAPQLHMLAVAGCDAVPPQYGVLARCPSRGGGIAVNLNEPLAAGFFGVNGSGKSYALSALCEMLLQPLGAIGPLRAPHCVVWMHHHPAASYEPEMLTSVYPNVHPKESRELTQLWGVLPAGLRDVVVLTLPDRVAEVQRRHPFVRVVPLRFPLHELEAPGLQLLLGLRGDDPPIYARQLDGMVRALLAKSPRPRLPDLLTALQGHPMDEGARQRVLGRLSLLCPWVDDNASLRALLRPGRLIIVDIRDAWLQAGAAMDLFALVLGALVLRNEGREQYLLTVALDEAHKFVARRAVRELIDVLVRERRHLSAGIALCSQDPISIPQEVLALLDLCTVFRHESRRWSQHLSEHLHQLGQLKAEHTARLPEGVGWMWAKRWLLLTDEVCHYQDQPALVRVRPRVSYHGGQTRTAAPAAGVQHAMFDAR